MQIVRDTTILVYVLERTGRNNLTYARHFKDMRRAASVLLFAAVIMKEGGGRDIRMSHPLHYFWNVVKAPASLTCSVNSGGGEAVRETRSPARTLSPGAFFGLPAT